MSRKNWRSRAMVIASMLPFLGAAVPARAANWFEMNSWLSGPNYEARLPACEDSLALGSIQNRFSEKENRFWNSSLEILGFDHIRETAFSPWTPNTIPRRFCSAVVTTSDGARRPVHYSISEDLGVIGAFWGIEWCVTGLDRSWAYNPSCAMAKP